MTPLWANSTTVRRPLDKMKPKYWFRHFFSFLVILLLSLFFGLKLRGTRHLATWLQNTLQWPHFGPTVQPLGDPWAKWSQRTGLDINFFILFSDSSCEEQDIWLHGYKIPPVTPLRANSTTVRRPLDKMKPKDWLRQFFPFLFYFRTQVERNKTSGYHGYKEPSSGPTLNKQYND